MSIRLTFIQMSLSFNSEVISALKTLQKYNFKDTELSLRKEAGLIENKSAEELLKFKAQSNDGPENFSSSYQLFLNYVMEAPDPCKLELSSLLYPVFVQLYLRLISGDHTDIAKTFLTTFRKYQEDFYQSDINTLSHMNDSDQVLLNPIVESFSASGFIVSIATKPFALLKQFLQENDELRVISSILSEQLSIQVLDGPPRTKLQLDCRRGALFGEAEMEANRDAVLWGLLFDPSLQFAVDSGRHSGATNGHVNTEQDGEGEHAPPKAKKKRDAITSSSHSVGAGGKEGQKGFSKSPALDRIPIPKLRDTVIETRNAQLREVAKLVNSHRQSTLGTSSTSTGTSTLSICTSTQPDVSVVMYTVCNVQAGESALSIRRGGVTCSSFTENGGWLASGFGSGRIRVWSLGPDSLRRMLPSADLALLDKDDSRVKTKMLYDENGETHPTRDLLGHTGSVHGIAFSPDQQLIASAGVDGTVRLWSSLFWGGALTVWRDHLLPVWCVTWAPVYGHYIATGSANRSAHLYATDHAPDALRVFIGHHSDVTSVCLHPNVNYLATGSADRAVRLFDVRSGKLARIYTGHKGSVQCLAFSPCGRYLASGGWCGAVCLWDLATGHQVGQVGGYSASADPQKLFAAIVGDAATSGSSSADYSPQWLTGPVTSLAFSPDNSGCLAAGGMEGVVRIWNTTAGNIHTCPPTSANTEAGVDAATTADSTSSLVGMQRFNKQQLTRGQLHLVRPIHGTASSLAAYYSPVSGPHISAACLRHAFFTRRTTVTALNYVHPYLLLAAGIYNQF